MPKFKCVKCGLIRFGWACQNQPCPGCGGEMKEVTKQEQAMQLKTDYAIAKAHLNTAEALLLRAQAHLGWAAASGADLDLEMETIDSLLRLVRIEAQKQKEAQNESQSAI